MGKLEFKEFVKKNPGLYKYVKNNEKTWQQLYEMFDMYGENNDIWESYLDIKKAEKETSTAVNDFIGWIKNINLDEIQDGLNSVGRVISVLQDFGVKDKTETTYKPRPIYKHFED